jgi:hypothetical protein
MGEWLDFVRGGEGYDALYLNAVSLLVVVVATALMRYEVLRVAGLISCLH